MAWFIASLVPNYELISRKVNRIFRVAEVVGNGETWTQTEKLASGRKNRGKLAPLFEYLMRQCYGFEHNFHPSNSLLVLFIPAYYMR